MRKFGPANKSGVYGALTNERYCARLYRTSAPGRLLPIVLDYSLASAVSALAPTADLADPANQVTVEYIYEVGRFDIRCHEGSLVGV